MLEYKEILRINSNQKGVPGYVYQSGLDYFWAQSSGNLTIFPYVPVRNMINELVPELSISSLTKEAIISILGYTPVPDTRVINTTAPLTGGGTLASDLTLSTQMNTNKLIGRYSSGTGVFEEITIGSNLSLSGNTLNATGGTSYITGITNTSTINLTNTLGVLSADFASLNISQFTNDSNYIKLTNLSAGTGISYNNTTGVITNSAPDQTVVLTGGTGISTSGTYPSFTITNTLPDQTVALSAGTGIGVSGSYPNFTISNTSPSSGGTVTSVGLSMPSAFSVANSPVTTSGTLAVTGAGVASQYIRGDGTLANFPVSPGGGGASVNYYLNGGTSQGTIGGNTYYQMSKTAVLGSGVDFSVSSDGYIAQFITDVSDPNQLLIPTGNWNFEMYFNASSPGGTPTFHIELYKYNGSTFTLITSNTSTPEGITNGTAIDLYTTSIAVPQTTLALTDRLAVRIYVVTDGRTITLHTQDSHLCEILTTFSTGITALNSLTAQVQYLTTGTSGTDFNIVSSLDTHTFNLPTASASKRGALSSADWSAFNSKQSALTFGNLTDVGTDGITISNGTGSVIGTGTSISQQKSDATHNGYLSSSDYTNFNTAYTNRITSLTTTGSSGASTLLSNVLNIPNYTLSGLGGVPTSRQLTINGTSYDLSADRTWSVGTVTNVSASAPISSSGGTTPAISITKATTLVDGYLSSTDWNTFNGKQAALGYTPENVSNKSDSYTASSSTTYASTKAIVDGLATKQNTLTTGNLTESTSSVLTITGGSGSVIGSGTTVQVKKASTSQDGYLASTDFTTFNNKQNALTNPITGTGTNNQIAYFNTTGSTISSLTTSTYPSLTELSYVKGVTSSIQTQLATPSVASRIYLFNNFT